MSIYAIGDVQGCFDALMQLLAHLSFDASKDTLWFAGDLVNRGSQSLEVLRFVKSLGSPHQTVLGNHDLHLLAVAHGMQTLNKSDTLDDILGAPDRAELIHWLSHRPLLIQDTDTGCILTHAGLAPCWDLEEAQQLAKEVETVLRSDQAVHFLSQMYGNQPDLWDKNLTGISRLRCITNYLTRMRFCDQTGRLNFSYDGNIQNKPPTLVPWFNVKPRVNAHLDILFGHWAALMGITDESHLHPLDTGCIWGGSLTAMRLSDRKYFSVKCNLKL